MRVRLNAPLRINLTGYDREAALFPAGEQDVPAQVVDFLRRHPEAGEILSGDAHDSHSDQAIDGANSFIDAGLTEAQAQALITAGFVYLEAAQAASEGDLNAVDGIGPASVKKIREA